MIKESSVSLSLSVTVFEHLVTLKSKWLNANQLNIVQKNKKWDLQTIDAKPSEMRDLIDYFHHFSDGTG